MPAVVNHTIDFLHAIAVLIHENTHQPSFLRRRNPVRINAGIHHQMRLPPSRLRAVQTKHLQRKALLRDILGEQPFQATTVGEVHLSNARAPPELLWYAPREAATARQVQHLEVAAVAEARWYRPRHPRAPGEDDPLHVLALA